MGSRWCQCFKRYIPHCHFKEKTQIVLFPSIPAGKSRVLQSTAFINGEIIQKAMPGPWASSQSIAKGNKDSRGFISVCTILTGL